MASEREHAPVYRLVRWVLLALIGVGVIGMHVLSEHDPGGGHGTVMDATISAASLAQPASAIGDHQAMDMGMGQTGSSSTGVNPAFDASLSSWLRPTRACQARWPCACCSGPPPRSRLA